MSSFSDIMIAIILSRLPRPTEDWQAGDLAICIGTQHFGGEPTNPKLEDMLSRSESFQFIQSSSA
jgi:hypothetical protein